MDISPRNSKVNEAANASVKTAKLMWKCNAAGEDPYIGLLNYRIKLTDGEETYLAQKAFGRKKRTLILIADCIHQVKAT